MDENNLTILLQQGDRNAYKQLFIKYYSPPLRICVTIYF